MPPQINRDLMAVFRAVIGFRKLTKKDLAKQLGISRQRFSDYLGETKPMPSEVSFELIELLELQDTLKKYYQLKRENNEPQTSTDGSTGR